MKRILFPGVASFACMVAAAQEPDAKDSFFTLAPVEVRAVRAAGNVPVTKTNIGKEEISKMNLGQDLPFLLNMSPSAVAYSDAGNGIGYTGIRIRGTDATRINITLNGIPFNDAESQGTFFVDLPDFASSASSIQVQRGTGTSSNGPGAFGASINFSSNELIRDPYLEISNSAGSFNSWKNTLKAGTGLIKKYTADLRLSRITSDGYIDRAFSRLHSFYFSTARLDEKQSLRMNIFSGKEKTYQAWYGISQADLDAGKRTMNDAGTEKPGTPYENETDNYTQTHYQFFFRRTLNSRIDFHTALFYTRGKGYYEQYKAGRSYAEFGLPAPIQGNDTIFHADFVRQLWLDNHFYGSIFSFQYRHRNVQATMGGGYSQYKGKHFGKVIWSSRQLISPKKWYDLDAFKTDANLYLKQTTQTGRGWHIYYDLQLRHVGYQIEGFRDNPAIKINHNFIFFNPKAGVVFNRKGWKFYLTHGIAGKEPNRDDFEAGLLQQPKPERLFNTEMGAGKTMNWYSWSVTLYHMYYRNQLVLTGRINDVGAYTRSNIPVSYRAGVELQGAINISKRLSTTANLAFSTNRVKNFTLYLDDYDNGGQMEIKYRNTPLPFSPGATGALALNWIPKKNTELSLQNKYTGTQYLDNTGNPGRRLDAFFIQDFLVIQKFRIKKLKEMSISVKVNNLLNILYEPNGYSFSYIFGGETVTENYYFPMAGRNILLAMQVKL